MIRRSDQKPVVMWLLPLYSLCYYISLVTSFGWMKAHAIAICLLLFITKDAVAGWTNSTPYIISLLALCDNRQLCCRHKVQQTICQSREVDFALEVHIAADAEWQSQTLHREQLTHHSVCFSVYSSWLLHNKKWNLKLESNFHFTAPKLINVIHKSGIKKQQLWTVKTVVLFGPCFTRHGIVSLCHAMASLILCRMFLCLQLYLKLTKKHDLNNLTSALCLEMLRERVGFICFITPALVSVTGHLQGELNNNGSVP